METALLINSIYMATEGEGVHIGQPQIFVRFQGCAIGCVNCDSKDTWDFDKSTSRSMTEVLTTVHELSGNYPHQVKRISITGGDPLHPSHVPQVLELSKKLKQEGFYINIEAAGTRIVDSIFDTVDFISFDFKTPSTNVKTNPELIVRLQKQYSGKFQVKAVIAGERDFEATLNAFKWVSEQTDHKPITWCLTPCYEVGEEFPQERFKKVIDLNQAHGGKFRVIGQQHKWVFGPDKKQV